MGVLRLGVLGLSAALALACSEASTDGEASSAAAGEGSGTPTTPGTGSATSAGAASPGASTASAGSTMAAGAPGSSTGGAIPGADGASGAGATTDGTTSGSTAADDAALPDDSALPDDAAPPADPADAMESAGASDDIGAASDPVDDSADDSAAVDDASAASDDANAGSAADDSAVTDDSTADVMGGISDLTVEANPNNVLSAFVSWTTSEPASSLVQFGVDALEFELDGSGDTTEHRVLVIGMRAETTYRIRAVSTGASGSVAGEGTFTTGALPDQIPVAEVPVMDPAKMQPGWTLMNVQKGNGTERALSGAPPAAVIYDAEGQPVWYHIHGSQTERGGAISVDMTDVGVLIGPTDTQTPVEVDWAGNEVWRCSSTNCGGNGGLSHHADKLPNGNHVVMRDAPSGSRTSQVFEELNAQNQVVHTIGVEDLISPPGSASGDWAHGNSIVIKYDEDIAYLSFRWLGVVKAQYSTRQPIWHLPASYGASGLGNMTFDPPSSQYSDIHDPEIHDDGKTLLVFDNGGFTGQIAEGNPGNLHTRVLEFDLDEENNVARLVWEFPGSFDTDPWYKQDLYVPFWGDADRLANGNVLVAAGRRGVQNVTPESRVFEVTKDTGEVVWELLLPRDHGVYRADRLWPLPLVRAIAE